MKDKLISKIKICIKEGQEYAAETVHLHDGEIPEFVMDAIAPPEDEGLNPLDVVTEYYCAGLFTTIWKLSESLTQEDRIEIKNLITEEAGKIDMEIQLE